MQPADKPTIARLLSPPDRSFFLFGPRGSGKSTWLAQALPHALRLDLLDHSLYLELTRDPHRLEAIIGERPAHAWVLLDEIQRVPALTMEVHRLMESRRWRFALCGSSARKLRRSGADLLGGRASTLSMESFAAGELREAFDLGSALQWGTLPLVHNEPPAAADILSAYVDTYLKQEVQAEGLVRNVPPFVRFLGVAGQLNAQVVNAMGVSRDAAVARATVDTYLAILVDTLQCHLLPAWRPGLKVREAAQPKLFWFDPGVARAAAGLLSEPADRMWQGAALETLVFHELRVYSEAARKRHPVCYYRTPAGVEVDFVIETARARPGTRPHIVAIEVKRSERWDRSWEKPLRTLAETPGVVVDRMVGIYTGNRHYRSGDLEVMPFGAFVEKLHAGQVY